MAMNEPVMKQIELSHKAQIERLRRESGHTLSSHAFASLYLWQQAMGLTACVEDDLLLVRCAMNGEHSFFFPCGDDARIRAFIASRMATRSLSLCYLRDRDVAWLQENFPDAWEFRRIEAADEYICDIAEYLELPGSRFAEIRRKLRKLEREHIMEVRSITADTLQDARAVVCEWYSTAHSVGEQELDDDHIAEQALAEMEALELDGIVLYADHVPVAVFAGFPLTDDTVDVLIGKTGQHAPRGAVYYGLHAYLQTCADRFTYCNHEEDLGIPGIREIKRSLCPIAKTQIWEAFLK